MILLLIFVLWYIFYLQLTNSWKLGILFLSLISLYYQCQYLQTKKIIHKKGYELTLGMACHATLLGWTILIGREYIKES